VLNHISNAMEERIRASLARLQAPAPRLDDLVFERLESALDDVLGPHEYYSTIYGHHGVPGMPNDILVYMEMRKANGGVFVSVPKDGGEVVVRALGKLAEKYNMKLAEQRGGKLLIW